MDIDLVGISPLKDTYSTLAYIQMMLRSQITDAEANKRGNNHDSTTTEILRWKAQAATKRGEIIFSTAVSQAKNEV